MGTNNRVKKKEQTILFYPNSTQLYFILVLYHTSKDKFVENKPNMARKIGSAPLKNITNLPQGKRIETKRLLLSETEENARLAHLHAEQNEICAMHKYNNCIARHYESLDRIFVFKETEITYEMRSLLIDWVINCHEQLGLGDDTLHFAVFIVDRFLSGRAIPAQKLQLVGVTALVIAAKYEEVLCPDLGSFIALADSNCDEVELKKAEKYILYSLNYKLEYVNPLYFLRRTAKANHYEAKSRKMAKYLLELMMLHQEFTLFTRSVLGATAMYLARKICQTDYNKNLFFFYANISKNEMRPCFDKLVQIVFAEPKYDNVESKYSKSSAYEVSVLARRYAQKHFK